MSTPPSQAVDAARTVSAKILARFEKAPGGSERLKADSLIQQALFKQPELDERDRAFVTALVMGVLRQWIALDHRMRILSGRPLKKILPEVRPLLRLGLFQLRHMSQVPDYAAINSTVELARKRVHGPRREAAARFVNAVLRADARHPQEEGIPTISEDPLMHLSLTASLPAFWVERLVSHYGLEAAEAMSRAFQVMPDLQIRVNTLRTTPQAYLAALQAAGIAAVQPDPDLPELLRLPEWQGSPRLLPGYEAGDFYVQNLSSARVARMLDPRPGERVLDLCAAPGSKTTHMAALMENTGSITAVELKPERIGLLRENMRRLGMANVEIVGEDALKWRPDGLYDRVLVDAPCSGTGTVRRNPEILLQLQMKDLPAYADLQAALLARGYEALKPGGLLVYSTCSLEPEENDQVVARFRQTHPEAGLEAARQQRMDTVADGFYMASLRKPVS